MKERPIIFNAEMVRAILDGCKTQTRRPLKVQPANGWHFGTASEQGIKFGWIKSSHPRKGKFGVFTRREWTAGKFEHDIIPCPFGQPGDRLWVRETWGIVRMNHLISATPGAVDEDVTYKAGLRVFRSQDRPNNGRFEDWPVSWSDDQLPDKWRPSIHMPRWASRILLEITDVRVERVQQISEDDAKSEGAACIKFPIVDSSKKMTDRFRALWKSIYGTESWERNDWVWVIEFKRIEAE